MPNKPLRKSEVTLYKDKHLAINRRLIIEQINYYLDDLPEENKKVFTNISAVDSEALELTLNLPIKDNKTYKEYLSFTYCRILNFELDLETGDYELKNRRYYYIDEVIDSGDYKQIKTNINNPLPIKDRYLPFFTFNLSMDVLNSFQSYIIFDEQTEIKREHVDRFDFGENYSNVYRSNEYTYFLRDIPSVKEDVMLPLIPTNQYTLGSNDPVILNNENFSSIVEDIWVKIIISKKDSKNADFDQYTGYTVFIPFSKNIKVKQGDKSAILKAFLNFNEWEEYAFLTSEESIVSASISPYPPFFELRNAYYKDEYIELNLNCFIDSIRLYWYEHHGEEHIEHTIDINGIFCHPKRFFPRYKKQPSIPVASIYDYDKDNATSLNTLLGNNLLVKIKNEDLDRIIVDIHNKHPFEAFDESILYSSVYNKLILMYETINIPIGLETFEFNKNKSFQELCEVYENSLKYDAEKPYYPHAFINLSCSPYLNKDDGVNIDITKGLYFDFPNKVHSSAHSKLQLDTFTDRGQQYLRYEYNKDLQQIERDNHKMIIDAFAKIGKAVVNVAFSFLQIKIANSIDKHEAYESAWEDYYEGTEKWRHDRKRYKHPKMPKLSDSARGAKFKEFGLSSSLGKLTAMSGFKHGITLALGALYDMTFGYYFASTKAYAELNSRIDLLNATGTHIAQSGTGYGNYYIKTMLNVSKPEEESLNLLRLGFKVFGISVNRKGIPNTHSRIFYNYLQCKPVFNLDLFLSINRDIGDAITDCFNEGVTYIHRFIQEIPEEKSQYFYVFPEDNLENMEVLMYNYIRYHRNEEKKNS